MVGKSHWQEFEETIYITQPGTGSNKCIHASVQFALSSLI